MAASLLEFKTKRRKKKFGVFEVDELWVEHVLPQMRSRYLLLLNLFPDQVDRFGNISNIQKSLINALKKSPATVLVYNCDDPNCQVVADECENNKLAFGIDDKISNKQEEAKVKCPLCEFELKYSLHQYAQLGNYRCAKCGFNRANPKVSTTNVILGKDYLEFSVNGKRYVSKKAAEYACYNLTGFVAVANALDCHNDSIDKSIKYQQAKNGRMEFFELAGRQVMINLAKNPVGFNQNINYVLDRFYSDEQPANTSVAFFVNAREGDGKNTNWLYDVNFESLVGNGNLDVLYGGEAFSDIAECFRTKNIPASRVENLKDLLEKASKSKHIYIIANYTAMFPLQEELTKLSSI